MCVTDRHDMTLVVKVVLNPNVTNHLTVSLQDEKPVQFVI